MQPQYLNMNKKIKNLFLKNLNILGLIVLTITTILVSSYFNYQKKINAQKYNNLINNIYLKKTLNEIINNLEPKYKIYKHKIKFGETFDKILEGYSIDKKEIIAVKENLSKKININKLKTNQKIQITLDQTNNKIKDLIFEISNTEKISLSRKNKDTKFDQEIITLKLDKKIIFKEDIILQSLYKSATDQNIPANTIIEFARIYGFQVDFQRDIRKLDKFQIMYEIFTDKNNKVIETGNILFANLKLSGQDNSLYYFDKKKMKAIMIKMEKVFKKH